MAHRDYVALKSALGGRDARSVSRRLDQGTPFDLRELKGVNRDTAAKVLAALSEETLSRRTDFMYVVGFPAAADFFEGDLAETQETVEDVKAQLLEQTADANMPLHIHYCTPIVGRAFPSYPRLLKEWANYRAGRRGPELFEVNSLIEAGQRALRGEDDPKGVELLKLDWQHAHKGFGRVSFHHNEGSSVLGKEFLPLLEAVDRFDLSPVFPSFEDWITLLRASWQVEAALSAYKNGKPEDAIEMLKLGLNLRETGFKGFIQDIVNRAYNAHFKERELLSVVVVDDFMLDAVLWVLEQTGLVPAESIVANRSQGQRFLERPVDKFCFREAKDSDILRMVLTHELHERYLVENACFVDVMGFPYGEESIANFLYSIPDRHLSNWWHGGRNGYRYPLRSVSESDRAQHWRAMWPRSREVRAALSQSVLSGLPGFEG